MTVTKSDRVPPPAQTRSSNPSRRATSSGCCSSSSSSSRSSRCSPRSHGLGMVHSAGPTSRSRAVFYVFPGSASPSDSTATSRTGRSRPKPATEDHAGRRRQLRPSRWAVIDWVATHRRHHKYSDKEGDPHSPWRFGNDWKALTKGLSTPTSAGCSPGAHQPREVRPRPARRPRRIKRIDDLFPGLAAASLLLPAADRRPGHLVADGRAHRVLLGHPGPGRAAPPRHLVGQLDLPRLRRRGLRGRATSRATCGGSPSRRSASPGTTCTTPTRPAPGTARSRARSTRAPG